MGTRRPWHPDGQFDARFSATWRHYRYTISNTPTANPFLAATAWHVHEALDLRSMILACDPLIGEHDFTSFCRKPPVLRDAGSAAVLEHPPTMVRRVLLARWTTVAWDERADGAPELLRFEIRATAFCHQMVRSIVGLLVDVGRGRRTAGEVRGVLLARATARAAGPGRPARSGYPDLDG